MNLACLEARPDTLDRDAVSVRVAGERMTRLMGYDLDIVLRSVKVCKYERHSVIENSGAVAARFLALGRKNVHKSAVKHRAEELFRLG